MLHISVPPSRVELVGTERRISMNAGTEKQLSCRASGVKPQAKIVWYHGHNKIMGTETLFRCADKKKFTLIS